MLRIISKKAASSSILREIKCGRIIPLRLPLGGRRRR
jgi:hypothetical protein